MNFLESFLSQVTLHPSKEAVRDCESSLTYGQLDDLSNRLAHRLAPACTILLMPRRRYYHIAALATLKAGGAVVYVSPTYPIDRIRYILEDCHATQVLTTSSVWAQRALDLTPLLAEDIEVITLDTFDASAEDPTPVFRATPEQEAYILYTSGTTGRPKGVIHTLESITCNAETFNAIAASLPAPPDLFATATDLGFVASLNPTLFVLAAGHTSVIVEESVRAEMDLLAQFITEAGIEAIVLGSSMGVAMVKQYDLPLKLMVLGGEKIIGVTPEIARKNCIYNFYGATECVIVTTHHITDNDAALVPAGRLTAPDDRIYILDDNLQPVADGETGEVYISSKQIAKGYKNLPALTAERFLPDPFRAGWHMWRTCDLGYRDAEGLLMLRGRSDSMFKLHGFRIEPGEIENSATSFPSIGNSACIKQVIRGEEALCFYYEAGITIDKRALRNHLANLLPDYMVPTIYLQLDSLPRNARGKVDRKAMPDPMLLIHTEMVPPATEQEQILYDIACDILGTNEFGVTDDLFEVGMSSLMAMKMVAEAERRQIKVKTSEVMTAKTIRLTLQAKRQLIYWDRPYDPTLETVVFVCGIALIKNEQQKLRMWGEHFNVMVVESTHEHYQYIFEDESVGEVVSFYYDLMDYYLPADARIRVFTGVSFGGKLAFLMAARWHGCRGQWPTVIMGDSMLCVDKAFSKILIDGKLPEWTRANGLPDNTFNPDFVARMTITARLEQHEPPMPVYEGDVVLLHANIIQDGLAPGNDLLWRPYAPHLTVFRIDSTHALISVDNDATFPYWQQVCQSVVGGRKADEPIQ